MVSKITAKEKFTEFESLYKRLGINLEQAIQSFLKEENISVLSVYHRIKEFESFYEKIERKSYKQPFEEIEDICGLRIICYYISDIEKIENVIKKEFEVLETQDKSETLGLKEFAYRSFHYIVQIKDSWMETPNYRGLKNLKAEIQIRTILMHAWAEVEHKLNYKSDSQVPNKFQRKLFRLSAKFEEADEQFDELKDGINHYRQTITETVKIKNEFDVNQEFNLDTYLAFLHFYFPESEIDESRLSNSFNFYERRKISFEQLRDAVLRSKPHVQQIAEDLLKSGYTNDLTEMPTELLGFLTDTMIQRDLRGTVTAWRENVKKWSSILSNTQND